MKPPTASLSSNCLLPISKATKTVCQVGAKGSDAVWLVGLESIFGLRQTNHHARP